MSNMLTASATASSAANATAFTSQRSVIRENMMSAITAGANLSTYTADALTIAAAIQLMTTTVAVVNVSVFVTFCLFFEFLYLVNHRSDCTDC